MRFTKFIYINAYVNFYMFTKSKRTVTDRLCHVNITGKGLSVFLNHHQLYRLWCDGTLGEPSQSQLAVAEEKDILFWRFYREEDCGSRHEGS